MAGFTGDRGATGTTGRAGEDRLVGLWAPPLAADEQRGAAGQWLGVPGLTSASEGYNSSSTGGAEEYQPLDEGRRSRPLAEPHDEVGFGDSRETPCRPGQPEGAPCVSWCGRLVNQPFPSCCATCPQRRTHRCRVRMRAWKQTLAHTFAPPPWARRLSPPLRTTAPHPPSQRAARAARDTIPENVANAPRDRHREAVGRHVSTGVVPLTRLLDARLAPCCRDCALILEAWGQRFRRTAGHGAEGTPRTPPPSVMSGCGNGHTPLQP